MLPGDYDINNSLLFKRFCSERGLKHSTPKKYADCLNRYLTYCDETLEFLIEEADKEEDEINRPAKRKIKNRLLGFRVYLSERYATNTCITTMTSVSTFYHHFDITIPKMPPFSYDESPNDAIEYRDLPTIDDIRTAVENTRSARRKAIFAFQACNGTSRTDISTNFTFKQFKEGIQDYFPDVETPQDIIDAIDGKCDELMIMPVFRMKRGKTNYRYHTIISPEATQFCVNYLKANGLGLKDDDQFFNTSPWAVSSAYRSINNKMGWGKRGTFDFFSSHRIRKFNASSIDDTEFAHYIQGRKPRKIDETYFKRNVENIREKYENYLPKFAIYTRYDVLINSEAYNQLLDEKNELEKQLNETKEEYERKIAALEHSNSTITSRMDSLQEQMDSKGLETQMVELQRRAAQHPLVKGTSGLMEYVMKIFEDQINLGDRKYYSDAEIDDMVRLALATKNRIEKMENTLTEEMLQEQYPEHYDEVTELVNYYKDLYINEELEVKLSDLQNKKVNKALLQFKKEILENKSSPENIDTDISMMIDPNIVNDRIDESLGLMDSVEAIYSEGNGTYVKPKFRL